MAGTTRPAQSRRKNRGPEGAIANSSTSHIGASAFKKEGGRRPGAGVGLWVLGSGLGPTSISKSVFFLVVVVPHVRDGIRAFVSSHARTRMHTRLCAHAHAGTISSKLLSKMRCTHTSTRLLTLRRRLSWRRPTNRVMKHLPTTAWSNRPKEHTRLQMQGPRCSRLFEDDDCAHTMLQQGAGF